MYFFSPLVDRLRLIQLPFPKPASIRANLCATPMLLAKTKNGEKYRKLLVESYSLPDPMPREPLDPRIDKPAASQQQVMGGRPLFIHVKPEPARGCYSLQEVICALCSTTQSGQFTVGDKVMLREPFKLSGCLQPNEQGEIISFNGQSQKPCHVQGPRGSAYSYKESELCFSVFPSSAAAPVLVSLCLTPVSVANVGFRDMHSSLLPGYAPFILPPIHSSADPLTCGVRWLIFCFYFSNFVRDLVSSSPVPQVFVVSNLKDFWLLVHKLFFEDQLPWAWSGLFRSAPFFHFWNCYYIATCFD